MAQSARAARRKGASPALRWSVVALVVAGVVAARYLGWTELLSFEQLKAHHEDLKAWVHGHLPLALAAFAGGYLVSATVPVPASLLHLAAGALLGLWSGVVVASACALLGATLAFLLCRFLFRGLVRRRLGLRFERIDRGIEKDGAWFLLTLRLIPAFPFFVVNDLMGLTRMHTATYVAVTCLGNFPAALIYVYTGTELAEIRSPADVVSPRVLVALAVLATVPLLLRLLLGRLATRRSMTPDASSPSSTTSETL